MKTVIIKGTVYTLSPRAANLVFELIGVATVEGDRLNEVMLRAQAISDSLYMTLKTIPFLKKLKYLKFRRSQARLIFTNLTILEIMQTYEDLQELEGVKKKVTEGESPEVKSFPEQSQNI